MAMAFAQFATLYPGPDAEESLPIVPICAVVLLSQTAIFIELALTPSWVQQYPDEPYALAAALPRFTAGSKLTKQRRSCRRLMLKLQ